ncbi:YkgJ family cysteine cluster protein [Candidatus Woesearchaeota archaeon]|nr:YkgJ family cysteine cluster protein [Candidatus Woesearchaeota archaeon]
MDDEDDSDPSSFKCMRCGFCCQLDVTLNENDIIRIKEKGHTGFYKKRSGEILLKKKRGFCIFFDYNNRLCSIYPYRPLVCRKFPFRDDSIMSNKCRQNDDFRSKVTQNIIMFMTQESLNKKPDNES